MVSRLPYYQQNFDKVAIIFPYKQPTMELIFGLVEEKAINLICANSARLLITGIESLCSFLVTWIQPGRAVMALKITNKAHCEWLGKCRTTDCCIRHCYSLV